MNADHDDAFILFLFAVGFIFFFSGGNASDGAATGKKREFRQ